MPVHSKLGISQDKIMQQRVRWHCRRGVRELDVLLHRFFDHHYLSLSPEQQAVFEDLLEHDDTQLQAWFFGEEPLLAKYQQLVGLKSVCCNHD